MAFAAIDGYQGAQRRQNVNAVGLHPARPAVNLDAGGIETRQSMPSLAKARASQNPS
jgi:hypothetical protein